MLPRPVLRAVVALLVTPLIPVALAQPATRPSAADLKDKPDDWFASEEGRQAVEFIIARQLPNGGWEKEYHKAPQPDWKGIGTIDNGYTYTELRLLGRAYSQTNDERARDAFNKGLDFLLAVQYPDSGGWPQRFPLPTDYGRFITYNDHAMINVMHVMRDAAQAKPPFAFVDAERRTKAKQAFDKGVECILKTQIVVNGAPTGWCQQYEPETLRPGKARTYELPSIAGDETSGVLKLLMTVDNPTPPVERAIHTSAAWLERSKVTGIRLERTPDPSLPKGYDLKAVEDPKAEPLWARFYEIETNRPFFCGRDGVKKYSMNEIEPERRSGYAWLRPWGTSALEEYAKWKAKHGGGDTKRLSQISTPPKADAFPPDIVVAADGSGQFKTVHEAVRSIPRSNRDRTIILVKDGVYNEKVRIDAARVTLRGQSRTGTRIEFAQLRDDFDKKPDDLGAAVVNVNGDDVVLENLTIRNTAGIIGPHSFAVYGRGDRTVIIDCDVLSEGADTVALWGGKDGRYYHARCNFRGAVDFVCPRGWCYVEDSAFYETKATAALWHDGHHDPDMKFVLRNCTFDGVDGWVLARHHQDAQLYLLDCTFSGTMTDKPPKRVIYPIGDKPVTEEDIKKNAELDNTNLWGERAYFHNCRREGGDYSWHANNLASASGAPAPEQVTAAWTFAGKWDPKRTDAPKVVKVVRRDGAIAVMFDEEVTVKGRPQLVFADGSAAECVSGSGSDALVFGASSSADVKWIDLNGGTIIATEAGDGDRPFRSHSLH
jgi:PelA/Pel-15E family pectate lyase